MQVSAVDVDTTQVLEDIASGDTSIVVGTSTNFPTAPFVAVLNNEHILVNSIAQSTTLLADNVGGGNGAIDVTTSTGFPGTPFVVQLDNEQLEVTAVQLNQTTLVGGITAAQTFIDVANASVLPAANFAIEINGERMRVIGVVGNTLEVVRGIGGTAPAAHANGSNVVNNRWLVNRGFNGTNPNGHGANSEINRSVWNVTRAQNGTLAANHNAADLLRVNTWTVQRGINNSNPAAHAANAAVDYGVPKGIYVAWNKNNTRGDGVVVSSVMIAGSGDGGYNFTTQQYVSTPNVQAFAPQIEFTQGTNDGDVDGGQMMVFWSSGGGIAFDLSAPDAGMASAPVAASQTFSRSYNPGNTDVTHYSGFNEGRITDAEVIPNVTPHDPGVTEFTMDVDIDGFNLDIINDLNVSIAMVHGQMDQVEIRLIPPATAGVGAITLLRNRTNAVGNSTGNGIAANVNMGTIRHGATTTLEYEAVGTVFDDEGVRGITAGNITHNLLSPRIGYFRPETGSLSQFDGLSAAQLSGTWTLEITDTRDNGANGGTSPAHPVQFLQEWKLHFTGLISNNGFGADAAANAATVGGAANNVYPTTGGPYGTPGVGPGIDIAIDKTLGSFSPYQGRIYAAYTSGSGTDTNVFVTSSDDNGLTWNEPVQVNDDSIGDNFTEGNRAQFTPAIAVDPITGTVAVMYYDSRIDAANARAASVIRVSVDGGRNWSDPSFLNNIKTVTDFLTGERVDLEPIPGNQGQAGANGFGDRQDLYFYNGKIVPVFASNENAAGSSITTADVRTAVGPRIISADMGHVTADFYDVSNNGAFTVRYNDGFDNNGVRELEGFVVQFDRPVQISSFDISDINVQYQSPNGGAPQAIALNGVFAYDRPTNQATTFGPREIGFDVLDDRAFATSFFIGFVTPQTAPGTYSFSVGPNVQDLVSYGRSVTLLPPSPPFDAPFTNTNDVFIPDLALVTSTVNVPALPPGQTVGKVTVSLNLVHEYNNDLEITLISPNGTRVLLYDQNGQPFDIDILGTTFDDDAATNIAAGTSPFTGTFRPVEGLAKFIGENPLGTWTLEIDDVLPADVGTLLDWSLTITPGQAGPVVGNLMDQNANSISAETVEVNTSISTLLAPANATTQQIALNDGTGFNGEPYTIQVGREQMRVVSSQFFGPTLVLDVIRGWNGTRVEAHGIGATVTRVSTPDIFSNPRPIASVNNGITTANPFVGPYDPQTLPLIIPGLHVLHTSLPDAGGNLVLPITTTLTNNITTNETTFDVADGSVFPQDRPFIITIGREQMLVTEVNGNELTVVRDYLGTSVREQHPFNQTVTYIPENLSLNNTVSAIDVVFSRPVNAATFTAADIISVVGPLGEITGPFTVTANPPGTIGNLADRVFRIGFPTQNLSGTYSIVLGSQIADTDGNLLDSNLNAGLEVLRGTADPAQAEIIRNVYGVNTAVNVPANSAASATLVVTDDFPIVQAPNQLRFDNTSTTTINQTGGINAFSTILNVSSSVGFPTVPFVVQVGTELMQVVGRTGNQWNVVRGFNGTVAQAHANGAQVRLGEPATIQVLVDITHNDVRDLTLTLISPTGTVIPLATNVGTFGASKLNFTNTVFDDLSQTPIQGGSAPFSAGPYNAQFPLSALNGESASGTWILTVTNSAGIAQAATINRFEIRLPQALPTTGFGEEIADRTTVSFRIFNSDLQNELTTQQWLAVGPVGNLLNEENNGTNAGPVEALAVDPSDPSGNTVYLGSSSGGLWKTTNFLTKDANGPIWIPLTDLGPTSSLHISNIAVYARNNDPSQSIILAATGNAGSVNQQGGGSSLGSTGVGFLRSFDGGMTWEVLDSTVNVLGNGDILTMNSAQRDHAFVGSNIYKVIFDPNPLPGGGIAVYAAVSNGSAPGLYRSLDAGSTWELVRAGNATDVVLSPGSKDGNGNLTRIYAAFRGEGVFRGDGEAPTTSSFTLLNTPQIFTPRVNTDLIGVPQIAEQAPDRTPNGAKGHIVLAQPALTNSPLADTFYQGWLYAAVATPGGGFDGLYLSKDNGFNWTRIELPALTTIFGDDFGTNNETRAEATHTNNRNGNGLGYPGQELGNYSLSLTIDPQNPNIIYLGSGNGIVRVDATKLDDIYAPVNCKLDGFTNGLVGSRYRFRKPVCGPANRLLGFKIPPTTMWIPHWSF
ncbi:MAG: proprotein convertase P-domain-containing protein [Zavarzinella sp.]